MGWLFGRRRKSRAELTMERLQQQASTTGRFDVQPPDFAPPAADQPVGTDFAMPVDNVFSITGRGLVMSGTVENGIVRVGQQVTVVSRQHGRSQPLTVVAIELFRKMRDSAQMGDEIGLLVGGLSRDDVNAGDQVVS